MNRSTWPWSCAAMHDVRKRVTRCACVPCLDCLAAAGAQRCQACICPAGSQHCVAGKPLSADFYTPLCIGKRGGDHPSLLAVLQHAKVVNAAYFSPVTGRKILTTCIDNRLRVWDLVTHVRFPALCRHHAFAIVRALLGSRSRRSAVRRPNAVHPQLGLCHVGRSFPPKLQP